MSQSVISVEGLGKRYVIQHEAQQDTLRDALHQGARRLWRRFRWGTELNEEEFWALRDISFEVQPGEVVGIIGRNGAGKSTLLKILSRITEPTTGTVRLRGRVASLLEVGTGFHPELSGRENIYLNGAILGMSRAEIRGKFDEIVAFAEVERFLDTPVKRYSSGMYVRLAFAVAAHLDPEILIVDEVLAVGDAAFQAKCLGKMESIARKEARTILFVSHNVSAVTRLCSRALLLDQGRVRFDGGTAEGVHNYLSTNRVSASGDASIPPEGAVSDSPIRLLSISFNGGQPAINRQPLCVSLRFEVSRPTAAGFGIGFCNIEGRRIVTIESDYEGRPHTLDCAGEHVITLRLPALDLVPGRYRIDAGAFSPDHRSYHYAPDCAVLDIQSAPGSAVHLQGTEADWRPAAEWRLDPA